MIPLCVFFFKQKTAYELRISDCSSDVCSSDLLRPTEDVTIGATAFYNRLDDAIANVTISPDLRQRQNVEAVISKGFEFTAQAKLADFFLLGSYAYSHSKVKASGTQAALDGMDPAQSPRHMASATLGWAAPSGIALSATLRSEIGRAH